jgi:hypothetical protein
MFTVHPEMRSKIVAAVAHRDVINTLPDAP